MDVSPAQQFGKQQFMCIFVYSVSKRRVRFVPLQLLRQLAPQLPRFIGPNCSGAIFIALGFAALLTHNLGELNIPRAVCVSHFNYM